MRLVKTFLVLIWLWAAVSVRAAENRYDLFAKTIAPITRVLASGSTSVGNALSTEFVLSGDGQEQVLLGRILANRDAKAQTSVELLVENPDKLLVRLHLGETTLVFCRNGQQIWATPKGLLETLAASCGVDLQALPSGKNKQPLGRLQLPFSQQQLVFLPALFKVDDLGEQIGARLLEVELVPEVARGLKLQQQKFRLWVSPDHKPVRLQMPGQSWTADLKRFESLEKQPEQTWEAPPDAVRLSAPQFRQILSSFSER